MASRVLGFVLALLSIQVVPKLTWADEHSCPQSVVLTAFEPYGGDAVNTSQQIMAFVAQGLQAQHPGLKVSTCVLPVVYGQATQRALNCINATGCPPSLVLSFGQSYSCFVHLSAFSENMDQSGRNPDNLGKTADSDLNDPPGPQKIFSNLPVEKIQSAFSYWEKVVVKFGGGTGRFVCNDTAYHLSRALQPSQVRYGFIHVPARGCESKKGYAQVPRLSLKIVETILQTQ